MQTLAIHSLTRSLKSTGKWIFRDGTHNRQQTTYEHLNLETESDHRADLVKIQTVKCTFYDQHFTIYTIHSAIFSLDFGKDNT